MPNAKFLLFWCMEAAGFHSLAPFATSNLRTPAPSSLPPATSSILPPSKATIPCWDLGAGRSAIDLKENPSQAETTELTPSPPEKTTPRRSQWHEPALRLQPYLRC